MVFAGIWLYTVRSMIAYAQVPTNQTLEPLIGTASGLLTLISLALLFVTILVLGMFTYQTFTYLLLSPEDKKKSENILNLLLSAVALAIFVSVWGIADYLRDLVGIEENQGAGTVEVPDVDLPERL